MTTAATRLAALATWLDKSSAQRRSPMGDSIIVGKYAEILPWDFLEPPTSDFAEHALPLFVPYQQAEGLTLPEVADLSAPAGQLRAYHRLLHLLLKMEDAAFAHKLTWRTSDPADFLPVCAVIGLTDPLQPISEALDAAGGGAVDQDAYPVLAVPLWAMSAKERADLRLPFRPS